MVVTGTDSMTFGDEQYLLVDSLSQVPHKILKNYHLESLSQMVLHELGHQGCFGFNKAVYFIDNPDFDHLIGVAGFCKADCKHHKNDMWSNPDSFSGDMKCANFNNDIRKIALKCNSFDLRELGKSAGMKNPEFFRWDMKHGNHGILMFEQGKELSSWNKNLLMNAAALLSLCGI
jgi:hypothetical protein